MYHQPVPAAYDDHGYPQNMGMGMQYPSSSSQSFRGGRGGRARGQANGYQRPHKGRGGGYKNRNNHAQNAYPSGGFGGNTQGYGPGPETSFKHRNRQAPQEHPQNWQPASRDQTD